MAGYYTQKRKISLFNDSTIVIDRAGVKSPPLGGSGLKTSLQTTSSYRTSAGEGSTQSVGQILRSNLYGSQSTFDNGHEFSTVKSTVIGVKAPIARTDYYGRTFVSSVVLRPISNAISMPFIVPAWTEKSVQGNKAMSKTAPTSSVADMSTFLGEFMRDGLPTIALGSFEALLKSKTQVFKNLGGEYLNGVFGWTPFIKDLEKFLTVVSGSYKLMEQYKKDSGRLVRRSYTFPASNRIISSVDARNDEAYTAYSSGDPLYRGIEAQQSTAITESEWIWFKGAYTYFLPSDESLLGKMKYYASLADKLLGLRITPEVLWNLAPWSWMADWFANIGDNLSVASKFSKDHLVLRYGYLMREYRRTVTATSGPGLGYAFPSEGVKIPPQAQIHRHQSKERVRATPYGFGINPDSLNIGQWAILGALATNGFKNPEPLGRR